MQCWVNSWIKWVNSKLKLCSWEWVGTTWSGCLCYVIDQRARERRAKSVVVCGLALSQDNNDTVTLRRLRVLEFGVKLTHAGWVVGYWWRSGQAAAGRALVSSWRVQSFEPCTESDWGGQQIKWRKKTSLLTRTWLKWKQYWHMKIVAVAVIIVSNGMEP